ncbi:MAG TPA: glucokinase [Candidatus Polarisedimenticolia bacterium]|nr:glucokinase [Candidatus Polarisedimenticolia bacterium]
MILAGDIGGTKTRLALFDSGLSLIGEATFASREHSGLAEVLRAYLSAGGPRIERACFGVAGPVRRGRASTTNLPWVVDAQELSRDLAIGSVSIINDLEANAYGIPALRPEESICLSSGAPDAEGNAALISAGTGLGEAGLYWDGARHRPFACEGGHAGFSPRDEVEIDLLRYLISRFGQVSWERVVSGPGLVNIYEFLRDTGRGEEPPWLARQLSSEDPGAVITRAAMDGSSPLCEQALDRFVSLYGSEAANLALKVMATGGVWVGGGMAPKIIGRMRDGSFMESFWAKGRMRPLLEAMPVRVIVNDRTALLGAARYAALAAEES